MNLKCSACGMLTNLYTIAQIKRKMGAPLRGHQHSEGVLKGCSGQRHLEGEGGRGGAHFCFFAVGSVFSAVSLGRTEPACGGGG
jgi:hypothetical protein